MPVLFGKVYGDAIKEILDSDKRINQTVFNREKEQVSRWIQTAQPLNAPTIQEINVNVSKFTEGFVSYLTKINANLEILLAKKEPKVQDIPEEILSIGPALTYYNALVKQITNPALDMVSKNMYESMIQQLLPYLNKIILEYKYLIDGILNKFMDQSPGRKKEIFDLLYTFVSVYSVYKAMYTYLNQRIYKVINLTDISDIFQRVVINDFPTLPQIKALINTTKQDLDITITMMINAINNERQEVGEPKLTELEEDKIKKIYENRINPLFSFKDTQILEKYATSRRELLDIEKDLLKKDILGEKQKILEEFTKKSGELSFSKDAVENAKLLYKFQAEKDIEDELKKFSTQFTTPKTLEKNLTIRRKQLEKELQDTLDKININNYKQLLKQTKKDFINEQLKERLLKDEELEEGNRELKYLNERFADIKEIYEKVIQKDESKYTDQDKRIIDEVDQIKTRIPLIEGNKDDIEQRLKKQIEEEAKSLYGFGKKKYIRRKNNNPMSYNDDKNDMKLNNTMFY